MTFPSSCGTRNWNCMVMVTKNCTMDIIQSRTGSVAIMSLVQFLDTDSCFVYAGFRSCVFMNERVTDS